MIFDVVGSFWFFIHLPCGRSTENFQPLFFEFLWDGSELLFRVADHGSFVREIEQPSFLAPLPLTPDARASILVELKILGQEIPWLGQRWPQVPFLEGIGAALMVPGLFFFFRGDILQSAGADWFRVLSLMSICLIAAMIGGPFIALVHKQALDFLAKYGKKGTQTTPENIPK